MKLNKVDDKTAYENLLVKYSELVQKLEQTEKDLADYQFNYPTIKELEQQIERIKQEHKQDILDLVLSNSSERADLEKENERLTVSYETLKLHNEEEIGILKSENAKLKEELAFRRYAD